MKDFVYKKKIIELWATTGEVIDSGEKYTESYVSSGHNSVSTKVYTNHEFWIRKDDGRDEDIQLSSEKSLPAILKGHRVTLVYAGIKGQDYGYDTLLINHKTQKISFLRKANDLNEVLKFYIPKGRSLFISIIAWIFFIFLLGSIQAASMLAGITFIGLFAYRVSAVNEKLDKLNEHLKTIGQEIIDKELSSENTE